MLLTPRLWLAALALLVSGCAARSMECFVEPRAPADAAAVAAAPLGSVMNPVRCHGPSGERAYLDRLRCSDGSAPAYKRSGSVGAGPYCTIMDLYAVKCPGATPVDVYMDMYHQGHTEGEAAPGFEIDAPGTEEAAQETSTQRGPTSQ